jgi:hypothetical protein
VHMKTQSHLTHVLIMPRLVADSRMAAPSVPDGYKQCFLTSLFHRFKALKPLKDGRQTDIAMLDSASL